MPGTPGMHQDSRARQCRCQSPGATRMIEMHVRENDVVDGIDIQVRIGECGEQIRHRKMRAGIDESGMTFGHDEMARIEARTDILGVDGDDARADLLVDFRFHSGGSQSLLERFEFGRCIGIEIVQMLGRTA